MYDLVNYLLSDPETWISQQKPTATESGREQPDNVDAPFAKYSAYSLVVSTYHALNSHHAYSS